MQSTMHSHDEDDDDDRDEGPVQKKSRFAAAPGKTRSMKDKLGGEEQTLMDSAYKKLENAKIILFPRGIDGSGPANIASTFCCWGVDCEQVGISERESGGKYNRAIYYQVGVKKDVKFQAQKLSLCIKMGVLYTSLESMGLETSHLCHNKKCWNPSHLHGEDHAANVSRNSGEGCGGWLFDKSTSNLYKLCEHTPACMHLRVLTSLEGVRVVDTV